MLPRRSTKEKIFILMGLTGFALITPFIFLRFFSGDYAVALLDAFISAGMLSLTISVYKTGNTIFASVLLSWIGILGMLVTVYLQGAEQVIWCYPAMILVYYLLQPKHAISINAVATILLFLLLRDKLSDTIMIATLVTIVLTNLLAYIFSFQTLKQNQLLTDLSIKDPLTNTRNRRALDEALQKVISQYQRNQEVTSLILLDIDHFKEINDSHGHKIGDQLLVKVAELISQRIRTTDDLYRIGGEEFVIMPVGASINEARELSEQLRTMIESSPQLSKFKLTISLGVAEYQSGETGEHWLHRADQALYQAKRTGRNKTCVAEND
ncbi:GGDEF domain-containing protein [Pleionea mediterranea]|uniref:diguanylate cyclase n=1 Tax=Pleionea mediterranea TaxID=523701 RepID=A0A316FKQ1_9GAMM|nr:GGDEF domain-containing protein [Pleionea mediterranea]PWK49284.1 diguanylate cyclase (GGDEF)-like protein [Pleionea mediterranea]